MTEILEWEIKQCLLCVDHTVSIVLPDRYMARWYFYKLRDIISEISEKLFPDDSPMFIGDIRSLTFDFMAGSSRIEINTSYDMAIDRRGRRYETIFVHEDIPSNTIDLIRLQLQPGGYLKTLCFPDISEYTTDMQPCTEETIFMFLGIQTKK